MAQKVDASLQSLLNSIQDVFRDCSEQKKRAVTEYNNRNKAYSPDVKSFEQMKVLSEANNGTMKVINDLIAKKIELLKIHSRIISVHGIDEAVKGATMTNLPDLKPSNLLMDTPLSSEELTKLRELATTSDFDVLDSDNTIEIE